MQVGGGNSLRISWQNDRFCLHSRTIRETQRTPGDGRRVKQAVISDHL